MQKKMAVLVALIGCGLAYKTAQSQISEAPKSTPAATREFTMVNIEYQKSKLWLPSTLIVKKGDRVKLTLINNTPSGVHGFAIDEFNVKTQVASDKKQEVEFVADKSGLFRIYCQMHAAHVGGQLLVLE